VSLTNREGKGVSYGAVLCLVAAAVLCIACSSTRALAPMLANAKGPASGRNVPCLKSRGDSVAAGHRRSPAACGEALIGDSVRRLPRSECLSLRWRGNLVAVVEFHPAASEADRVGGAGQLVKPRGVGVIVSESNRGGEPSSVSLVNQLFYELGDQGLRAWRIEFPPPIHGCFKGKQP
jgi:hypothetical protein